MTCSTITVTSGQPTVEIVSDSVGFVKEDGSQFAVCLDATGVAGTARESIEYTIRVSNVTASFKLEYEYAINGVIKRWTNPFTSTQVVGDSIYLTSFADKYRVGKYTALKITISDIVAA